MNHLKKLTILHSNDLHGDFLAEQTDERLVGGVSMLSGYINQVKSTEKNTLYCIAGDMFRGSVIDTEYKGISTIEIMNMLSPDVVTIGNHETDYGVAHLLFIEKCAKFPIINANLHIKTNGARLFKPYHIVEIDGMKILFIGILTEEVLSQTKKDELIGTFIDIDEAAQEIGKICNTYNSLDVDLTVLLTHIGFEEDKQLAARLDPAWGVDIIIGGHSHTLPDTPETINNIIIVQAGTGTDQIGRFDITVNTDQNCIDSYTWQTVPVRAKTCPRDQALEHILQYYQAETDKKYGRLVTKFKRTLTHPSRYCETELGGLLSDIVCENLGLDLMLLGSGGIRSKELGPIVLYSDFIECFPYDDSVHMLPVTGKQLRQIILHILRDEVWSGDHCEFYQFSGRIRIIYRRDTHDFEELSFDGKPLCDEKIYRIGIELYHYKNLEKFLSISYDEVEKNGKIRVVSTSCRDILDEYLSAHQLLDREIDGRLVVK
ncbi:MAG: 5'-nucleotidase C-terminal domain-containing protein [Lachnospiraceae bacterium]|nr:5'-nucleotidase C-terminal domain-containing protein [Lachnospiraceae bacterium]